MIFSPFYLAIYNLVNTVFVFVVLVSTNVISSSSASLTIVVILVSKAGNLKVGIGHIIDM